MMTFHGSVRIQPMGQDQHPHFLRHTSGFFELFACTRRREEHQGKPRPSSLCDHLNVNLANTGVKNSPHEKVVRDAMSPGVGFSGGYNAIDIPINTCQIPDDN